MLDEPPFTVRILETLSPAHGLSGAVLFVSFRVFLSKSPPAAFLFPLLGLSSRFQM